MQTHTDTAETNNRDKDYSHSLLVMIFVFQKYVNL